MNPNESINPTEDSDEIAAALAAVYTFCGSQEEEESEAASSTDASSTITPWAAASRLENLAGTKLVSAAQLGSKSFSWRNSFARKWTSLSIYVSFFLLIQSNSASALERIEFNPDAPALNKAKAPVANTGEGTADDASANKQQLLCPMAPPIISTQDKSPSRASSTTASTINKSTSPTIKTASKPSSSATSSSATNGSAAATNTSITSTNGSTNSTSRSLAETKGSTSATKGSATATNGSSTATNGSATATNGSTTSTNGSATARYGTATAINGSATATNESTTSTNGSAAARYGTATAINGSSLSAIAASAAAASSLSAAPRETNSSSAVQIKMLAASPSTEQNALDHGNARVIRIAVNPNTSSTEILVPDGAQIIDESNHHLLAELPAQSRWQISMENGVVKRLSIIGKISHSASAKVLVASSPHNYEQATYTRQFKASGKGGFTHTPRIVDSSNPKFFLPVKSPAPVLTAMKQDDLRAVSFKSSSDSLMAIPKSFVPPPVVTGYIIQPTSPDGVISCDGKTYRGTLIVKPRIGEAPTFLLINQVELEDYLLSVVPSEMPSAWSIEALKAQSIAARSYALSNMNKHQLEGYDLKASTDDQVYLGVQSESDVSNRAVAETKGLVLKHQGKVVTAYFHSAGGGRTEEAENVWGSKLAYLKSVPDFDDQSPHFNWNRSIPVTSIEDNLKKQGRDIGGLLGIFPLERSQSQRVTSAMLAGTLQTIILSGEELRKILSLPSTVFNIGAGPDSYVVAGRGFGHGLGMSQWGAKYLSEQGYNASQILSYYYKDVTVDQF